MHRKISVKQLKSN